MDTNQNLSTTNPNPEVQPPQQTGKNSVSSIYPQPSETPIQPTSQSQQQPSLNQTTSDSILSQIPNHQDQRANFTYQGVGIRFLSLLIDGIIFTAILTIFIVIFPSTYKGGCNSSIYIGITPTLTINEKVSKTFYGLCGLPAGLYFLTIFLYYVLLEWKLGATLGKKLLRIKVVKITGEPLDIQAALIRNIVRIIDAFPFYLIGAIAIWSTKYKQRLGDLAAKTIVVKK